MLSKRNKLCAFQAAYMYSKCVWALLHINAFLKQRTRIEMIHKHWRVQNLFLFDTLFFVAVVDLHYCFFYLHWLYLLNSAGTRRPTRWQFQETIKHQAGVVQSTAWLWVTHSPRMLIVWWALTTEQITVYV